MSLIQGARGESFALAHSQKSGSRINIKPVLHYEATDASYIDAAGHGDGAEELVAVFASTAATDGGDHDCTSSRCLLP